MLHKTNIDKTKMKNRQIIFTVGYFTIPFFYYIFKKQQFQKKKRKNKTLRHKIKGEGAGNTCQLSL